jgi:predicted DNA-binding protein (MmcQ/YjbR family)
VSAKFGPGEALPMDLLRAWITESYKAVAPKTLAKTVD